MRILRGPATVTEELISRTTEATREGEMCDDTRARRPAWNISFLAGEEPG